MKQSQFFAKTLKEWPKDEESANARLLLRAGFIAKSSSGVYTFLPIGLKVLEKINSVIREELNAFGASELLMPALVSKKYWDQTGRWQTPVLYRLQDSSGQEYGLGFTHEEVLTNILKQFISSWRDLPLALYQIQTKFRDEPRAKSGLLRGKEFLMKDLYSFHAGEKDLEKYYWRAAKIYAKIFKRLGLKTKIVEASGGDFTKDFTHEFQVLTPVGEDTIFYCQNCSFAQNKEISRVGAGQTCPLCKKGEILKENGIEVGNIFKLGSRFSKPAGLNYKDKDGEVKPVIMGSYGIGPTRIMGAVAELHHDDKGVIWPQVLSPFKVHLVELAGGRAEAQKIYKSLCAAGIDVFYDDRKDASPGEKLFDADLLGISWRLVASAKTVLAKKIELKARSGSEIKLIARNQIFKYVK
ncbi:MAG: aminoacyl--tRNA ligase-related protein [Patescibacteria group bacterium]